MSDGFDGPRHGEFAAFHRTLSVEAIPGPEAPWFPDINEFALTFDAYEAMGGLDTPGVDLVKRRLGRWCFGGVPRRCARRRGFGV